MPNMSSSLSEGSALKGGGGVGQIRVNFLNFM